MANFIAYPSRGRLALLLLGSASFVILGLWLAGLFGEVPSSRRYSDGFTVVIGWVCVVFFGLCGAMAVKKLFETGEQLNIGAGGIRWTPWSDQTIPWSEITDVTTWESNQQKAIVLHLRDRSRFPGRGLLSVFASANRMLTGGDISISLTGTDRTFADASAAIECFRARSGR